MLMTYIAILQAPSWQLLESSTNKRTKSHKHNTCNACPESKSLEWLYGGRLKLVRVFQLSLVLVHSGPFY